MERFSNNKSHNSHKDDADLFREQSLRAIRRRKTIPKYLFAALVVVALLIVAATFAAYFID